MEKKLLFSVTDFEFQMFSAGGKGGQGNQHCNTAARIIHKRSGAQGVSRDERAGGQNRKLAFNRCVQSKEFQTWLKIETARQTGAEAEAQRKTDEAMKDYNLRLEVKENGKWKVVDKII